MRLPPEAIAEFKQIFHQERGIWLSDDEANHLANQLYVLGKTLTEMTMKHEKDRDDEVV